MVRACALALGEFPTMNSIVRWGRAYQRRDINIFLQVSRAGREDDLTGMLLKRCDQMNLEEIAQEMEKRSEPIKKGRDPMYGQMKGVMKILPGFVIHPLLRLIESCLYTFNLWSPLFKMQKDAMGSVMVTSVGMLGIERALAPIVPISRCPVLVTIGKIKEQAVVEEGQVVIKPIMPLGITLDHRLMDGKSGGRMLKAFRGYLENP